MLSCLGNSEQEVWSPVLKHGLDKALKTYKDALATKSNVDFESK